MDYKCDICNCEFEDLKSCFAHLKRVHFIWDNSQNIKCVVNFFGGEKCGKSYNTYDSLRKHVKSCILKRSEVMNIIK